MNKEQIQNKLETIIKSYDTIVRKEGYKVATDIKVAYFFDLVHMINLLLEMNNGTQQSDIGKVTNQTSSGIGSL